MSSYTELVSASERAWNRIQKEFPDVPDAVVVIGSGGRRASTLYGHFAADRWLSDDKVLHEVLLVAEQLHRGAVPVFTTLLHEAVHGIARTREVKDVSGYRHNKRFKTLCEEVGMIPPDKPDKRLGFSSATLAESTQWIFQAQIDDIQEALNVCRVIIDPKEKIKSSWAAVCQCDRKIRVGKKIYNPEADEPRLNIACTLCGGEFYVEEDDE